MLMQVICSKASIFTFRHKVIALNGVFSLLAHRKNFIPILLPILLKYEVFLHSIFHADYKRVSSIDHGEQHVPSAQTSLCLSLVVI